MTPEFLQSISGAKGLPMPTEEGRAINTIEHLLKHEKRLRELQRRLKERDDEGARLALNRLMRAGLPCLGQTAKGRNMHTAKAVEWTHAECAQACQGLDDRYYNAMRYTYALDDTAFHPLSLSLWEWALERREQQQVAPHKVSKQERADPWPEKVIDVTGAAIRYMRDLVDVFMLEVRQPWRFVRKESEPDIRMLIMNVEERVWRRRLSPVYEGICDEFVAWLAIGRGHMSTRLRESAA